jgi:hypothetical protein
LASNAEFLYYEVSHAGIDLLITVGASYVLLEDQYVIDCTRRVERIEISGPWGIRVSSSDSGALKSISGAKMDVLDRAPHDRRHASSFPRERRARARFLGSRTHH